MGCFPAALKILLLFLQQAKRQIKLTVQFRIWSQRSEIAKRRRLENERKANEYLLDNLRRKALLRWRRQFHVCCIVRYTLFPIIILIYCGSSRKLALNKIRFDLCRSSYDYNLSSRKGTQSRGNSLRRKGVRDFS